MSSLFPRPISCKTRTATFVRGEPVFTETTFGIEGTVQPINGKDHEQYDVGRLDMGKVTVFTGAELKVGIEGQNLTGDLILYGGLWYEIIKAMPWDNFVLPHRQYIAECRSDLS